MGGRVVFLPKFHPELNPIECVYRYKMQNNLSKMILFFSRDESKYVRDRNQVGTSQGFLERVLSADSVVTAERCKKYFLSCQRCHKIKS